MENVFKNILDDDEIVINLFKPSKFKFYFTNFLVAFVAFLIFPGWVIVPIALDEETVGIVAVIFALIIVVIFLIIFGITLLYSVLTYKKRYYAYTNKRILIQSGTIGIDYKSLDHEMIGAVEVKVDLLDKLLRKNTGTIKFGSQASPISKRVMPMFMFKDIFEPYDIYKEIKKHIASVKQ